MNATSTFTSKIAPHIERYLALAPRVDQVVAIDISDDAVARIRTNAEAISPP